MPADAVLKRLNSQLKILVNLGQAEYTNMVTRCEGTLARHPSLRQGLSVSAHCGWPLAFLSAARS